MAITTTLPINSKDISPKGWNTAVLGKRPDDGIWRRRFRRGAAAIGEDKDARRLEFGMLVDIAEYRAEVRSAETAHIPFCIGRRRIRVVVLPDADNRRIALQNGQLVIPKRAEQTREFGKKPAQASVRAAARIDGHHRPKQFFMTTLEV